LYYYVLFLYLLNYLIEEDLVVMENEFIDKWKSQVKKGTLSFIVLNTIWGKELYGYELITIIKETTKIEIAEGTLYPLLNRLKKEELVSSKWVDQESGIPRRYYLLTKHGVTTIKEMTAYWEELELSIKKITHHGI